MKKAPETVYATFKEAVGRYELTDFFQPNSIAYKSEDLTSPDSLVVSLWKEYGTEPFEMTGPAVPEILSYVMRSLETSVTNYEKAEVVQDTDRRTYVNELQDARSDLIDAAAMILSAIQNIDEEIHIHE